MQMTVKADAPVKYDFFDRFFHWPELFRHTPMVWPEVDPGTLIRVDEFRENGNLVVRAEMPGLDIEKDVEVTITDHVLHIAAEHREEETVDEKAFYRKELRYGSFRRDLPLPEGCDENEIKATYQKGILEIRVPVLEEKPAEVKKIEVTTG